jgi:hypothetical protein
MLPISRRRHMHPSSKGDLDRVEPCRARQRFRECRFPRVCCRRLAHCRVACGAPPVGRCTAVLGTIELAPPLPDLLSDEHRIGRHSSYRGSGYSASRSHEAGLAYMPDPDGHRGPLFPPNSFRTTRCACLPPHERPTPPSTPQTDSVHRVSVE